VQLIAAHAALADAIGGTPSEWSCYRFMTKLREHSAALAECVDRIAESLRRELPSYGRDVAIEPPICPPTRTVSGSATTTAPSGGRTPIPTPLGDTGAR
jgi:hypothetical protein